MNRAYAVLDIKSVDDESWTISGVASTPTPDRMGDIVEPLGARFTVPMPLLWQHDAKQPIGEVTFAKPTADGIPFRAQLVKASAVMSQTLRERLLTAWESMKTGLVKAVSIGFAPIEWSFLDTGGVRFTAWEWLELSAVTIPANAEATINTIKSFDALALVASGRSFGADLPARPANPPGVSGPATGRKAITLKPTEGAMPKTNAERIAALEAARAAKAARLTAIQDQVSEEGRTKTAAEREEFDTLKDEISAVDAELKDLRDAEAINRTRAAPVGGASLEEGSAARGLAAVDTGAAGAARPHYPVPVRAEAVPKGIAFTRYVMAMAAAKGNQGEAFNIAQGVEAWKDTPAVASCLQPANARTIRTALAAGSTKAAVAAGSTTDPAWAAPLVDYQNLVSDFAEYLRPLTIIGRLNLRRVPFKVKIPRQTGASTVNWTGEGKPKPVSALAFDTIYMDFHKIAGIVVVHEELLRFSDPAAEGLVRDDLGNSVVQFMDREFVDPAKAAVANVSPASITHGLVPVPASGQTADALKADVRTLFANFAGAGLSPGDGAWIMTQQQALAIGMMENALGQPMFPTIGVTGGTFFGLPVVASENMPATGVSPSDGHPLILLKQSEVLLADDGDVAIDASREASVQMVSDPVTGAAELVSLWQHNMMGIRAERFITWLRRRDQAVGYIANADYL